MASLSGLRKFSVKKASVGEPRAYVAWAMRAGYERTIDFAREIRMVIEFTHEGREVTDYVVVLVRGEGKAAETIRVYDSVHGHNEMHRYTSSGGKQTGKPFHSGSLGEGMRSAIADIERGHRKMIQGWERQ